ncbi:MAG: YceI family protein [Oceanospirillaceae bacterium]
MKNIIKNTLLATGIAVLSTAAFAADYTIDSNSAGAHAQIDVAVSHLGISYAKGRFNSFEGTFSYDKDQPNASKVSVSIDTSSYDSNHAKRDKHVQSGDFLDVAKYPKATFESTNIADKGDNMLSVTGDFTLHGKTQSITFAAKKLGEGTDPWGGYRAGFEGSSAMKFSDFGIDAMKKIGTDQFKVSFFIEGVRK